MSGPFQLPRFSGTDGDWPVWQEQFRAFIYTALSVDVLETDKPEGEHRAAWVKADTLLYSYLVQPCQGSAFQAVRATPAADDYKSGKVAWANLCSRYASRSAERINPPIEVPRTRFPALRQREPGVSR